MFSLKKSLSMIIDLLHSQGRICDTYQYIIFNKIVQSRKFVYARMAILLENATINFGAITLMIAFSSSEEKKDI